MIHTFKFWIDGIFRGTIKDNSAEDLEDFLYRIYGEGSVVRVEFLN